MIHIISLRTNRIEHVSKRKDINLDVDDNPVYSISTFQVLGFNHDYFISSTVLPLQNYQKRTKKQHSCSYSINPFFTIFFSFLPFPYVKINEINSFKNQKNY